jgi:hypothetical protein
MAAPTLRRLLLRICQCFFNLCPPRCLMLMSRVRRERVILQSLEPQSLSSPSESRKRAYCLVPDSLLLDRRFHFISPAVLHKTPLIFSLTPSPGSDLLTVIPMPSRPLKCACTACQGHYHRGQVDGRREFPKCHHWIWKDCAYEWTDAYDGELDLPCGCLLHHKPGPSKHGQADDGQAMPECHHWIWKGCAVQWADAYDGDWRMPCGCVLSHRPLKVQGVANEVLRRWGSEGRDAGCVIM